ncbi:MAG: ABC transporter permease [Chthonomonadales bacterium]|nr:ABC transporter permease [Chthonomonadales bacterium]
MAARASALVRSALPPLTLFLTVAALWHGATAILNIPAFVLPGPADVAREAFANGARLVSATGLTAVAALSGFCASLVIGCLIGFAFSQWPLVRSSCYPYAIFLQTVPIVAIAPLIIIWFGTGLQSVILVAFIVSLFPMITNATAGLTTLDRDLLALFRLYHASRWQTLTKLRLPAAVPFVIAGAKTSSGLSVIGAIVGEFFAGYGAERYGLGYLITLTSGQLKTAYLFSAVLCSTALGLVMFGAISAIGNAVLNRWFRHQTHG